MVEQRSGVTSPTVWALVLVLGGGGAGLGGSVVQRQLFPPRPDPQTGAAAKSEHAAILREMRSEIEALAREMRQDIRETAYDLRTTRPPQPTRLRIGALESGMRDLYEKHGEEWQPPAYEFATMESEQ